MDPLLLSLDSSTPCGSVALTRGSTVLAEISLNVPKVSHSDYLLRYAEFLLSEAGFQIRDIDALAVVVGPGSFTGLRVGIATIQGLALALGLRVYPVSSLQALAFANGQSPLPVCALLDARKKEVYVARYSWCHDQLVAVGEERVISPQSVIDGVTEKTLFVGNGAVLYAEQFREGLGDQLLISGHLNTAPRAGAVGLLVNQLASRLEAVDPFQLKPVYVRPSDAEMQAAVAVS